MQAAAAAFVTASVRRADAHSREPYFRHLGFQTFTVDAPLKEKPRETLKRLADIGYREVELHQIEDADLLVPIARDCGLSVIGSHIPSLFQKEGDWFNWVRSDGEALPRYFDLNAILAKAKVHTLEYLGYADVPPAEVFTNSTQADLYCAALDRVGARCREAGVRFAYHNHFQEFAKIGDTTLFELLAARCDPRHVAFEIDLCWAAHAGQDPAALISRMAGRAPLLHLKDRRPGVPVSTDRAWPQDNLFTEVGTGTLDVPAILRTAHASGVEHVFVEQDRTAGDPVVSLSKSRAYVAEVGL